jgi:hypothetical protein
MEPNNWGLDFSFMSHEAMALREQTDAMRGILSGHSTFLALQRAINELSKSAPPEHDVVIAAFNLSVTQVRYIEPHAFIFEGFDDEGHAAFATCHFSQLVAHVIYIPKRGPEKIITGFSVEKSQA